MDAQRCQLLTDVIGDELLFPPVLVAPRLGQVAVDERLRTRQGNRLPTVPLAGQQDLGRTTHPGTDLREMTKVDVRADIAFLGRDKGFAGRESRLSGNGPAPREDQLTELASFKGLQEAVQSSDIFRFGLMLRNLDEACLLVGRICLRYGYDDRIFGDLISVRIDQEDRFLPGYLKRGDHETVSPIQFLDVV